MVAACIADNITFSHRTRRRHLRTGLQVAFNRPTVYRFPAQASLIPCYDDRLDHQQMVVYLQTIYRRLPTRDRPGRMPSRVIAGACQCH